jgi:hypothetical protein
MERASELISTLLGSTEDTITGTKKKLFLWSGVIILVTMSPYTPAMRDGYIWDDDSYITENPTLRASDGLRRIWFELRALPNTTHWCIQPFGLNIICGKFILWAIIWSMCQCLESKSQNAAVER